jgi:stage III sporulation protein AF
LAQFGAYIKNIVVFTMLMVFADILMPDKYSKKYVNFVLGIVLAVNAISPFMTLTGKEFDIKRIMEAAEGKMLEADAYEGSNILFESIFEENLKASVENELKKEGLSFDDVSVKVNENQNGEYVLEKIEITGAYEDCDEAEKIIGEKYAPDEIVFN